MTDESLPQPLATDLRLVTRVGERTAVRAVMLAHRPPDPV
jgi:hypothetical protein